MMNSILSLLAQAPPPSEGGTGGCIFIIIILLLNLAAIAGMWKVFSKAGEPGWAILVPIYSAIVLGKIAGRSTGWSIVLLVLIPVGFFIVPFDIAKKFGKSGGFGVGLLLLPMIFYPMLGFGSAKYQGGKAEE